MVRFALLSLTQGWDFLILSSTCCIVSTVGNTVFVAAMNVALPLESLAGLLAAWHGS